MLIKARLSMAATVSQTFPISHKRNVAPKIRVPGGANAKKRATKKTTARLKRFPVWGSSTNLTLAEIQLPAAIGIGRAWRMYDSPAAAATPHPAITRG